MSQFGRVFSTSRFPGTTVDSLHTSPSNDSVIVIVKKRFFVVQTKSSDGKQLSTAALRVQFERCRAIASEQP
jgi:hypothetical protein